MDGNLPAGSDRPLSLEEVFQPWELTGASRRDCRSERGRLLLGLARISLFLGGLSLLCAPLGLLGFPLGLVIRRMARRDLDAIFAGEMDPRGRQRTEKAWSDSQAAIFLNLVGSLVCGVVLVAILWFLWSFRFG
jgi:hypothetical protein